MEPCSTSPAAIESDVMRRAGEMGANPRVHSHEPRVCSGSEPFVRENVCGKMLSEADEGKNGAAQGVEEAIKGAVGADSKHRVDASI